MQNGTTPHNAPTQPVVPPRGVVTPVPTPIEPDATVGEDGDDDRDCPMCGSPLVVITIQVGAGPRTMCSCGRCDRRWWRVDGRLTSLTGVIADLAEPAPARARVRR